MRLSPILYKWLIQKIGAELGDVRHFQLGMMYLAYAFFIGILGRLGWLLGGATLSFAVMALTITAWIFMGLGFLGATPRMYAYPVIALIVYALIRDRPHLLVVTSNLEWNALSHRGDHRWATLPGELDALKTFVRPWVRCRTGAGHAAWQPCQ